MDPRESQDPQDSKAAPELRDFQGLREPSDHLETRVQLVNQVCQECQALTAHRVTQEKKAHLERKDIWVLLVPRVPSDIPAPEESRDPMESVA